MLASSYLRSDIRLKELAPIIQASVLPADSIATSRHSIDGTIVAVEDTHDTSVADTNKPCAVWTPCHLRGGEMVLFGQIGLWGDGHVWFKRCERITEEVFSLGWSRIGC